MVLTLVAAAVLVGGLRRAPRSRQPTAFRAGIVATALGVVCLWALPLAVIGLVERRDLQMLLLLGALFVAASLLGGGLNMLRLAGQSPREAARAALWDDLP